MVGSIGQGVELNSVWFFVASVVKARRLFRTWCTRIGVSILQLSRSCL